MRGYVRERNTALDNLRIANDTLEQRVDERTTELAVSLQQLGEAQDQIVATARRPGWPRSPPVCCTTWGTC
jgi:hypothetical protein